MKENFLQKNRGTITLILIAAVIFWVYTVFFRGAPKDFTQPTNLIGKSAIEMLNRLNSITLDGSVFSSPAFHELKDFELVLPEQPVGRSNPFAPVR
ncbi:MAG: hypothetical protein KAR00_00560 [Candidatus Pacebacteria bacterium]|nr:hypothetical protein [Candidatus Paceibacterota bacterium]